MACGTDFGVMNGTCGRIVFWSWLVGLVLVVASWPGFAEGTDAPSGKDAGLLRPGDVVEVVRPDAVLRVGPGEDFDRRTPLASGVRLKVRAFEGAWVRVDLGAGEEAWVGRKDVREVASTPTRSHLRNVLIRPGDGETWIDLQLTGRVAFDVLDDPSGSAYRVRLYDTTLMMHELLHLGTDARIRLARVRQVASGVAELELALADRGLWGWSASYIPLPRSPVDPPGHDFTAVAPQTLHLRLRKAPAMSASAAAPLAGLTVVVDAGHGGEDPGAVGAGGLREKDVNVAVAQTLADRLVARGARVVMTRRGDETVGDAARDLERRVTIAREGGGAIFVSIHHNARPRVEDGRVARGVYVYYYRAQSADLARSLTEPLARAIGERYQGHVFRSFHVIRQTWMPAVLVEVAFLSNPEEEAKMRDAGYAARVASGLLEGIEQFVKGRQP